MSGSRNAWFVHCARRRRRPGVAGDNRPVSIACSSAVASGARARASTGPSPGRCEQVGSGWLEAGALQELSEPLPGGWVLVFPGAQQRVGLGRTHTRTPGSVHICALDERVDCLDYLRDAPADADPRPCVELCVQTATAEHEPNSGRAAVHLIDRRHVCDSQKPLPPSSCIAEGRSAGDLTNSAPTGPGFDGTRRPGIHRCCDARAPPGPNVHRCGS